MNSLNNTENIQFSMRSFMQLADGVVRSLHSEIRKNPLAGIWRADLNCEMPQEFSLKSRIYSSEQLLVSYLGRRFEQLFVDVQRELNVFSICLKF
jgi:hypothetical protein